MGDDVLVPVPYRLRPQGGRTAPQRDPQQLATHSDDDSKIKEDDVEMSKK